MTRINNGETCDVTPALLAYLKVAHPELTAGLQPGVELKVAGIDGADADARCLLGLPDPCFPDTACDVLGDSPSVQVVLAHHPSRFRVALDYRPPPRRPELGTRLIDWSGAGWTVVDHVAFLLTLRPDGPGEDCRVDCDQAAADCWYSLLAPAPEAAHDPE